MFIPPLAGGAVPTSEFGGLPGNEFGGSGLGSDGLGGSGLNEGALGGALGENGLVDGTAGTLAGEFAPGAAAELGSAVKGAPMMPFMPMSPMMGGADGGERRRTAWLDEEEDIWAADTDPAPAVIGGGEQ
jgi:hypothetical protein